ncbi:hypothetical protein I4U23_000740 [Adineta vaga]|nr:hypothetical protein I4U23_000740 [Adineta vaga]
MQKGRPAARLSIDRHELPNSYADGFSAGYEAGRRASLGEGTQQRMSNPTGQRFRNDIHYQRSPSQSRRAFAGTRQPPIQAVHYETNRDAQQHFEHRFNQGKTQNDEHLSDGFQGRKSLDDNIHDREHGINGQLTNPLTQVHFQSRGHY